MEILQLPALMLLSGEYPATELFSSQPDLQLPTELDHHLFSASLAELNCIVNTRLTQSKLKLLYDWWSTANQFVLTSSPLRPTTRDFCRLNPCGNSPLWREDRFVSYEYAWPFIKCTYRTYSMLLKILPFALYTSPLSVQTLQSRTCLS
jgi:hypothetical protein